MAQHPGECTRSAYGPSVLTAYGGSCARLTRSPSTSAMKCTSHRWEGHPWGFYFFAAVAVFGCAAVLTLPRAAHTPRAAPAE